ncbi:MAG: hypothetical protein HGB10_10125 [Coriobacteriia bacterium]|nr:hypothetical protein [Coriobacteriia bacterium]
MTTYSSKTQPAQFRLPQWAHLFVAERAAAAGSTKTEVILEALECLKQRDVERLMAEGYAERAAEDREFAASAWATAQEGWPEW